MLKKSCWYIFFTLVLLSLLTPFFVFKELLFPFITSKAFFFRIAVEAALPFYLYLILTEANLRPKLKSPLNLAVLVFLLINIITSFTGVNVSRSLWGNFERMGGTWYLVHLSLWFFYVQILGQKGEAYLKHFLQSFIFVGAVLSVNGVLAKFGGPTLTLDSSAPDRISSTFGNPIFFASFLIIPGCLAMYLALRENDLFKKIVYWCASVLSLLGIILSATRGAVMGLSVGGFIAAFLYIILVKQAKVKRYGLIIVIAVCLLAGALFTFRNNLPAGSLLYRVVNLKDSNTQARLIQWKTALTGFKEHPLFGVGAENYYIISNSHWDSEMYKYDPSWFDKPHNYLLEVLVTNGLFGFLAYLAIFVLGIYGLWRAYNAGLLTLGEGCVMLFGLLAYQVQNFFVFDTVSASMAIFGFLGILGFLIKETSEEKTAEFVVQTEPNHLTTGVLIVAFIGMCYLQYASNLSSIKAAKLVNYGFSYTQEDPQKASDYFNQALALPFNLDVRETSNYYSNFTASLVSQSTVADKKFIIDQLKKATINQRSITEKIKNDPLLWMRLSMDEMNLAIILGENPEKSKLAIDRAVSLAPKRVELLQLQIQYYSFLKDWKNLSTVAKNIVSLNPYNSQYQWQLAMGYYLNGQIKDAVAAGDSAISAGFKFSQLRQFAWYIQYYEEKKDFTRVAPLLEKAIALEPNEIGLYVDLARVYAELGDYTHARLLAEQVIQSDPSQKTAMEKFIKGLLPDGLLR